MPACLFQRILPLPRSRHRACSVPTFWSTELTKTRSLQMTGVAAEGPGRPATHFTFSVFEKVVGGPFSVVEPLKNGPRHGGQFSARTAGVVTAMRPPSVTSRTNNFFTRFIIFSRVRHKLRRPIRVILGLAYNRP